jgi:hypothetical protein
VSARSRRRRRRGIVTRALVGDQLFQLTNGLAARGIEPRAFRFRTRHASELTYGGPAERSGFERVGQRRQRLQRFGHAQLLLRGARCIPKQALDIFAKAAEAHVHVRRRAPPTQQPAAFLCIRCGTLPGQARQRFMRRHPVALGFALALVLARSNVRAARRGHILSITRRNSCSGVPRGSRSTLPIRCESSVVPLRSVSWQSASARAHH